MCVVVVARSVLFVDGDVWFVVCLWLFVRGCLSVVVCLWLFGCGCSLCVLVVRRLLLVVGWCALFVVLSVVVGVCVFVVCARLLFALVRCCSVSISLSISVVLLLLLRAVVWSLFVDACCSLCVVGCA